MMSMKWAKVIILLVLAIGVYFLPDTSYKDQKELHSSLLQLSSIILAITGAWAAIIYPDALKNIMKDKDGEGQKEQILLLIKPMILSLVILGILISIELSAFILGLFHWSAGALFWFRKISLFFLLLMYMLQIISIAATFLPLFSADRKAKFEHNKIQKRKKILRK